mmetsp:Transcript_16482/g.20885  ORF Transcript_16482/g.20885 Transcript_16482/m.20885 type:complete len:106 (-) Transcript_16482:247-564(-)
MKKGRHLHSSCIQVDRMFVFGGSSLQEGPQNSIEERSTEPNSSWSLITPSNWIERLRPAVAAIDDYTIVIMGGSNEFGSNHYSDVLLFSTSDKNVRTIISDTGFS